MTLASFKLINTGTTLAAVGFITEMFGHPFKKGDIPAGQFPRFLLPDGMRACPYSWGGQTKWSDGSLKFASFMLKVPADVPVGGSLVISIDASSGGWSPSARTLADVAAASNLQVRVTGLENLAGDWISNLNQGITDNDDVKVWMDGSAGKVWRVRQQFMQGQNNHGQLECYWYVGVLGDGSIAYNARICQPWYDVDLPPKAHRTFSAFQLLNGSTPIRDCVAMKGTPRQFGVSGSVFDCTLGGSPDLTIMAGSRSGGFAARLSSTGVLPSVKATPAGPSTPLRSDITYYLRAEGQLTSKFLIGTNSSQIISGTSALTPTDAGTGVHTLNIYPRLCHFSSMYTCGADGQWDRIGATVPGVRFQMDTNYWISTRAVGSYETRFGAISSAAPHGPVNGGYISTLDIGYCPNGSGAIATQSIGQTGELPDLGLMPAYYVSHLVNQLAADERLVRITGLCDGHFSLALKNVAQKAIPGVNNTIYAGMPSQKTNFVWTLTPTPHANGFTAPPADDCLMTFTEQSSDHMPELSFYPYLRFGRPEFLDQLTEKASNALTNRGGGPPVVSTPEAFRGVLNAPSQRNYTVGGVTYWGCTAGNPASTRADAWATRTLAQMAGICPDSHYECASYKAYFNDCLTATCKALSAWVEMTTAFYQSTGGMQTSSAPRNPNYHRSYWAYGICAAVGLAENLAAFDILCYWLKRPAWIYQNFGGWHIGHDYGCERIGPTDGSWDASKDYTYPLPTDVTHIVPHVALTVTWSNVTGRFVAKVHGNNGYVPTLGDRYMFSSQPLPLPGGFSSSVPYYVVDPIEASFQLAAMPGGAPILPTDTSGINIDTDVNTVWNSRANLDTVCFAFSPDGFPANLCGALSLAKAVGGNVDPVMLADQRHRRDYAIAKGYGNPKGNLKYTMKDSY